MKVKEIAIIGAVVAAAAAVMILKQSKQTDPVEALPKAADAASVAQAQALPRLVDLGAGKCIPCKMMKPILDDLKANYA
ncbi:MAG: hypothetical protein PHU80_06750, partial [Kiritimatiellae bacterium]|nr:hypothetical protein [Kiritimatiellia bacterium]